MAWSDDGEIASVERGDLRLVKFLARGDDAGVDEAEIQRRVLLLELGGAGQRLRTQRM
jgi:hypothetical protein